MNNLTKNEMEYICQSIRSEHYHLINSKRIAELNDKRFIMETDLNLCESILRKLNVSIECKP